MRQFDTGKENGGLQRIALWACAAVAMMGIIFTLGFFIGRASSGTQVTVYLQNPEGVYVPAQTAEPFSEVPEVRLMPSDEESEAPATAQTTVPSLSVIASTTIIPKRTESPAVTTTGRPEEPAGTTAASSAASQTAVSPAPAETTTAVTSTTAPPQTTEAPRTTAAATTLGIININTATQSQLETMPGIGPVKAAAIIAYRQEHGAFASVDDLIKVSGIGKKTLSDLRPHVTVG